MARTAPQRAADILSIRGAPRGMVERSSGEILAAIRRGLEVPEDELPRFPRTPRWNREPDFDECVARVKAARDQAATRLGIDPGVLCSRERLESIVRRRPTCAEELEQATEMRRWQIRELGTTLLEALRA
jgi:ribonuclease D